LGEPGVLDRFDFSSPPFDRLTEQEKQRCRDGLDIAVFPAGGVVIPRGARADGLFVIADGWVEERQLTETIAGFGPGDLFDLTAVFGDGAEHTFAATEETLCFVLPRPLIKELARGNAAFSDWLQADVAARIRTALSEASKREMAALAMARVGDAFLHPPVIVGKETTLHDAVRRMKAEQGSCILVDGAEHAGDLGNGMQLGILTDDEMRDLVILDGVSPSAAVGPLARPIQQLVSPDAALFSVLTLLTQHTERRVVVAEGQTVRGVLEQADALAHLANNSQGIALRIDRAVVADDLVAPSLDIARQIASLHATGVRIAFISQLVTSLNRKLFRKLFELTAPPGLIENSCLIVMGSEGRGEQILKTDQDNGLIIRDGFDLPGLRDVLELFSRRLEACGYPPCPGRIMVSNPEWAKSQTAYRDSLFDWLHHPSEESLMNLAIFFDAVAVAGDESLLQTAKDYLMGRLQDNQGFFHNFAKPIMSFDTPTIGRFGGLFERRRSDPLDIKKAAIFPLVHGVRAYALEKHFTCTHTIERLEALADANIIESGLAGELTEAFIFLSTLRLDARLKAPDAPGPNMLRPDSLSKLDYDQFKDCLAVVRKFKETVAHHFHLNQ
jgi:CBS domain-containing protein